MIFDVLTAHLTEEFGGRVSLMDQIADKPAEPLLLPMRSRQLSLRVKLAEDERVTLSTGERLENLAGFVAIQPQLEDFQAGQMGIGAMWCEEGVPEYSLPVTYRIKVLLPPTQFADLVSTSKHGRIPSRITMDVRGMKHPDEFSKAWDVKSSPHLHVASLSFVIPLVAGEHEETATAHFLPATQLQVSQLLSETRTLGRVMERIDGKLKWVMALIAAIGLITLALKY